MLIKKIHLILILTQPSTSYYIHKQTQINRQLIIKQIYIKNVALQLSLKNIIILNTTLQQSQPYTYIQYFIQNYQSQILCVYIYFYITYIYILHTTSIQIQISVFIRMYIIYIINSKIQTKKQRMSYKTNIIRLLLFLSVFQVGVSSQMVNDRLTGFASAVPQKLQKIEKIQKIEKQEKLNGINIENKPPGRQKSKQSVIGAGVKENRQDFGIEANINNQTKLNSNKISEINIKSKESINNVQKQKQSLRQKQKQKPIQNNNIKKLQQTKTQQIQIQKISNILKFDQKQKQKQKVGIIPKKTNQHKNQVTNQNPRLYPNQNTNLHTKPNFSRSTVNPNKLPYPNPISQNNPYKKATEQLLAYLSPLPISQISKIQQQPTLTSPIPQLQQYIVYLTNLLRLKYNLGQVTLSTFLNKIAQEHSEDMVKRNFFAHVNPDKENIGERGRRNKYFGAIGENLAQAISLNQAQIGFINSRTHFQNAINPNWEQIGVGVAIQNQVIYLTVVFTPRNLKYNKLKTQQITKYRTKLSQAIKSQTPNLKYLDQKLSSYIQKWLTTDRQLPILSYIVRQGKYRIPMTTAFYEIDYTKDWVDRCRKKQYFKNLNPIFKGFGIGIVQTADDDLEIYVVYI